MTDTQRTIRRNTIFLLLSQMNQGLSYVYTIIIARLKGPEFLGGLNYGLTLVAMVGMIAQLGIGDLLVREISAHREKTQSTISAAIIVTLSFTTLLVILFNAVLGRIEGDPTLRTCLRLLSIGLFLEGFNAVVSSSFMAIQRMGLILLRSVTWNVIRISATLIVLSLGRGILSVVVVSLASTAVITILNLVQFRRYIGPFVLRTDKASLMYLIVRSPIFLSLTISVTLSWQLDTIMLKYLGTLAAVGLYTSAYKMFQAFMQVPQAYLRSCFPELSRRYHSGKSEDFRTLNERMLKNTVLYAFAAVGLTWAGADLIIAILGSRFAPAAQLLRVLVLGLIPWSLARNFAYGLVAADLQHLDLIANVVATLVNATLNAILIPLYGATGAAAATAASLTVFLVMEYVFARRLSKNWGIPKWLLYGTGIGIGTWGVLKVAMISTVGALAVTSSVLLLLGLLYWRNQRFREWVKVRICRRLKENGNSLRNKVRRLRLSWEKTTRRQ